MARWSRDGGRLLAGGGKSWQGRCDDGDDDDGGYPHGVDVKHPPPPSSKERQRRLSLTQRLTTGLRQRSSPLSPSLSLT